MNEKMNWPRDYSAELKGQRNFRTKFRLTCPFKEHSIIERKPLMVYLKGTTRFETKTA